jgi:hypothetical protein
MQERIMGTPANIIIEFENESFLLPKGKDQILLFCGSDGYPFNLEGVMHLMVKAYEKLINTNKYSKYYNMLSPEDFASELIRISFYKRLDSYRIMPATRLMFEQYDKNGYFVDKAFEYICSFKFDDSNNCEVTLTLKDGENEITKSMNEWKGVCNIDYSIAIAQHEKAVLMNDNVPCKICLIQAMCVNNENDMSFVNDICDDLKEYKKNENIRLRGKLPKWATPFV